MILELHKSYRSLKLIIGSKGLKVDKDSFSFETNWNIEARRRHEYESKIFCAYFKWQNCIKYCYQDSNSELLSLVATALCPSFENLDNLATFGQCLKQIPPPLYLKLHNSKIMHSDWLMQITWLLSNQNGSFQSNKFFIKFTLIPNI